MKIVHWCTIKNKSASGMLQRAKEISLNEGKIEGIKSYLADPGNPNDQVLEDNVKSVNHQFTKDADIHILHSAIPPFFYQKGAIKGKTVFVIHGMPEYAFMGEQEGGSNSMGVSMNLIHDCDMSITFFQRHKTIWEEYANNPNDVVYIPTGIDLEKWSTSGPVKSYPYCSVGYMDIGRNVKSPFHMLYACQKAFRENHHIRMQLLTIPADHQLLWMKTASKMHADKIIDTFHVNPVPNPEHHYRGLHMLLSHTQYGDISNVAIETMACGCPVLLPEGKGHASMHYRDGDVNHITKCILEMGERVSKNRKIEQAKARKIAETHYNIKNSIKAIISNVYEKLI